MLSSAPVPKAAWAVLLGVSCASVAHAQVSMSGGPVYPFADLDCDAFGWASPAPAGCPAERCGTPLEEAYVWVKRGYNAGADTLVCDRCPSFLLEMAPDTRDPAVFRLAADDPARTGRVALRDYVQALASVRFETTEVPTERTLAYSLGGRYAVGPSGRVRSVLTILNCTATPDRCRWGYAQRLCADPTNDLWGRVGYLWAPPSAEAAAEPPLGGWDSPAITPSVYIGGANLGDGVWRTKVGPDGCPPYATAVPASSDAYFVRSGCDVGYPVSAATCGIQCAGGEALASLNCTSRAACWFGGPTGSVHHFLEVATPRSRDRQHFSAYAVAEAASQPARAVLCEYGGVGDACVSVEAIAGERSFQAVELNECECEPPAWEAIDVVKVSNEFQLVERELTCDNVGLTDGCSCNDKIASITVAIDRGYSSGDALACHGGICAINSYASSTGVRDTIPVKVFTVRPKHLPNTMSLREALGLLNSIRIVPASVSMEMKRVTWSLSPGVYIPETGSIYEFFSPRLDWDKAQSACASTRHDVFGMGGYLATLSTAAEHALVPGMADRGRLGEFSFFVGASDVGEEGRWRWVTGPESGCLNPYIPVVVGERRSACNVFPVAKTLFDGCGGDECDQGVLIGEGSRDQGTWLAAGAFDPFYPGDAAAKNLGEPNERRDGALGDCRRGCGQDFGLYSHEPGFDGFYMYDVSVNYPGGDGYMCEWGGLGTLCIDVDMLRGAKHVLVRNAAPPPCLTLSCPRQEACYDAFPTAASVGDASCGCVPPLTQGTASGRAVCLLNECTATCGTCISEWGCAVGQTCVDPSQAPTHTSDWQCTCDPPSNGSPAGTGNATCVKDECVAACSTCLLHLYGPHGCGGGQVCEDSDTGADSSWQCRCLTPAVGQSVVGRPATCILNECLPHADCASCIVKEDWCGAGRTCRDDDTAPDVTNNWECQCEAPWTGIPKIMTPAQCFLNECVPHSNCSSCILATDWCGAGQSCNEPSLTVTNDWECVCNAPSVGRGLVAKAVCVYDECLAGNLGGACLAAGQSCQDGTDPLAVGDFVCACAPPATGQATGAVARCELDECIHGRGKVLCVDAGQRCVDGDQTSSGDYVCSCRPPASGVSATGGAAACTLDECEPGCATCVTPSGCAAGQSCVDANTSTESTADWECVCDAPWEGTAVVGNATCTVDDCAGAGGGAVCGEHGQECDGGAETVEGDWACRCARPAVGAPGMGTPARCEMDECGVHGGVCAEANQTCEDRNASVGSSGDWVCLCGAPSVGEEYGRAADCVVSPSTHAPPIVPRFMPAAEEVGAVSGGVAAAAVVAGGAGPALQLVVVLGDCTAAPEDRYPFVLHPSGVAVGGSLAAGAVVGNLAVTAGGWAVAYAVLKFVTAAGGRGCVREADAQGFVRFPSAPLSVFMLLYQGTTLAAFELLLRAPTAWLFGVGLAGLAVAVGVPCALLHVVRRDVPYHAFYCADAAPRYACTRWFIGPGEWVSRRRETHWMHRWSCAVRMYRVPTAHYFAVEMAAGLALSAVQSLSVAGGDPLVGCGHVKAASAVIFAALLVLEVTYRPHCHPRNNALDAVALACQAFGLAFTAAAFYHRDRTHWTAGTGGSLLTAALACIALRTVVDAAAMLYVMVSGRRRALQGAAFARHDAVVALTRFYCQGGSGADLDIPPGVEAAGSGGSSLCLFQPPSLAEVPFASSPQASAVGSTMLTDLVEGTWGLGLLDESAGPASDTHNGGSFRSRRAKLGSWHASSRTRAFALSPPSLRTPRAQGKRAEEETADTPEITCMAGLPHIDSQACSSFVCNLDSPRAAAPLNGTPLIEPAPVDDPKGTDAIASVTRARRAKFVLTGPPGKSQSHSFSLLLPPSPRTPRAPVRAADPPSTPGSPGSAATPRLPRAGSSGLGGGSGKDSPLLSIALRPHCPADAQAAATATSPRGLPAMLSCSDGATPLLRNPVAVRSPVRAGSPVRPCSPGVGVGRRVAPSH